MRAKSITLTLAVTATLVAGPMTATASTSDELASVTLGGLRVAAVGYWPDLPEQFGCNSYLVDTHGVPETDTVIWLRDVATGSNLGGSTVASGFDAGTRSLRVCGERGPSQLRLDLSTPTGALASSEVFTWGGTPPVVTGLPDGEGSAAVGDASITTSGPWLAPLRQSRCTSVRVTGTAIPRGANADTTVFYVVDVETRRLIGLGSVIANSPGQPSTPGSGEICWGPDGSTPGRALALQLSVDQPDGSSRLAEGDPFTWSPEAPTPPPAASLPFTVTSGETSLRSQGVWTAPSSRAVDPDTAETSYLVRYAGVPFSSTFITLIDAQSREVISAGAVYRDDFLSVPAAGLVPLNVVGQVDPQRSFYVQAFILAEGSSLTESGPYTWDAVPPKRPAGSALPGSVSLGPVTVTTRGDWTAPRQGDKRRIAITGLDPSTFTTVGIVDVVTREVYAQEFIDPEQVTKQGSADLTIDSTVPRGSRFALQVFAQSLGFNESKALRWDTPSQPPGAVRSLTAAPDAGKGTLRVTWKAPTSDGGSRITKYEYRVGKSAWKSTTSLRIDLSGLRSGRAVEVGVRAVNAAGTGPIARVQGTPR